MDVDEEYYSAWSDMDLVEEVDERCCATNDWETEFVEDIIRRATNLSSKQREKIIELLRRDDAKD